MTQDSQTTHLEKFWPEILESFRLEDDEKEHVIKSVISLNIRGVNVCAPCETVFRCDEKTGEQYSQDTMTVPGEPYGSRKSTIFICTEGKGKHLKVLNNCGLHGNAINYLSRELYGIKQNEIVTPKKK